ncbi:MAG: hypothetical protein KDF60_03920 [Calditrichaeota bacterium]|nr:hypothetical protein [Calditrichota bacterium]
MLKKAAQTLIILALLIPQFLLAQSALDEMYSKGPQKDWNQEQVQDWWRWYKSKFYKSSAIALRQTAIMNGNKITTEIWNYGSISSPGNRITDIVWEGLGYAYEFAPFIAAEVEIPEGSHPDARLKRDANGRVVYDADSNRVWVAHVISDGLISNGGEVATDGSGLLWGFQPMERSDDGLNVYLNSSQNLIPTSDDKDTDLDGKPDSWPDDWYNSSLRNYVWPGALGQGATNADKEAFFVFDDRDNREFQYFPYPGDSLKRGLGLEVEARYYQWANPLAEDAIFLIYKIRNKGYFDLNKVIFGMWGDPHIGGPNNYADDLANFDTNFDMVFAWDGNGLSDVAGRVPGYLGYKFLESPGLASDGKDNDGDGMIDESWTNGIDDDGDWRAENDDVGVDGVPNTGDEGEGDGIPTAGDPFDLKKPGEPNYEFTDIDESDMIGLTSFTQPDFGGINISDDEEMWTKYIQPGTFDTLTSEGDRVFLYGSGRVTLKSVHTTPADSISEAIKRFSIGLIIGQDRDDLVQNAITVQDIYNSGYQFAKPPTKPKLTVVPGDRKVTLYWDKSAELSVDPIAGEVDFEGYAIYRSTDPGFSDAQTITDVRGNRFLFDPLKSANGATAKFDLKNNYSGPSAIPYTGRGVSYYLGDNTGLQYVYIDSNQVVNGQTYFYAVVSYDHGSDSLGIPPSECSKIITYDPTTNTYTTDVNTAIVIPRSKTAGYVAPNLGDGVVNESGGLTTGSIFVDIIDENAIEDDNNYVLTFTDTTKVTASKTRLEYTVEDLKPVQDDFISFYGRATALSKIQINPASFVVKDQSGTQFEEGVDYDLDGKAGLITVFDPDSIPGARMADDTKYTAEYTYYPMFRSTTIDSELTNEVFDGLRLVVKNENFGLNLPRTRWSESSQTDLTFSLIQRDSAKFYPSDYEIRFFADSVGTALTGQSINFEVWNVTQNTKNYVAVTEPTTKRNGKWDPGDNIFILENVTNPTVLNSKKTTWQVIIEPAPTDTNWTAPEAGDLLYIATFKPFVDGDKFSFNTNGAKSDVQLAKKNLDDIRVVPNPYVATNAIEPKNNISRTERGYRRLYFDKVPAQCTIRIYTLAGELVRTLEHDSSIDDGKVYWDLLTKDNLEVAYGLYFFHVDAPGIGKKVGKFAIIK